MQSKFLNDKKICSLFKRLLKKKKKFKQFIEFSTHVSLEFMSFTNNSFIGLIQAGQSMLKIKNS